MLGLAIASTQFFLFGKRNFTKNGYMRHVKAYTSPAQPSADIVRAVEGADGVDLEGKVVVITGANSGLGKELTTYAAAKGATVYMLCRSMVKAEPVRNEIAAKTKNENIKILLVDVGEREQVKKVAKELKTMEEKVDCLVCNAGVLLNERRQTSDGLEATFASHLLGGSYMLTMLLLPIITSRVVFVTSGGMYTTNWPKWSIATNAEGEKFDGTMAYAYAKRGQVILSERLAKQHSNIKFVTCHPGWAATNAVDDAFGDNKKYLEPLRSAWEGAEGIAWLIATDEENLESGALYLDRVPQRKHLSGPFFTEGTYSKNSEKEIDEFMANLEEAAEL